MVLEQFKDGEDNVVDIAEAGGFALLGVMESSRPVDCNVRSLNNKLLSNRNRVCLPDKHCTTNALPRQEKMLSGDSSKEDLSNYRIFKSPPVC